MSLGGISHPDITVKIATWNINSLNSRIEHVVDWCVKNQPDVLCLQETKCVDEKFPQRRLQAIGYEHLAFFGEKSYNGVALISKYPIDDVQKNLPGDAKDAQRRVIAGTIEGIRILNAYIPNGQAPDNAKYKFKLEWIMRLRRHFDKNFDRAENVLLCGDFNVAPHEMDVWKVAAWRDKIHFTKPERDAIRDLKKWGFVDVFRQVNGEAKEFSWWTYFNDAFGRDHGLRLDHVWASEPLAELCTDCWIDKEPRALDRPSDHAPVIADFMI